MTTMFEDVKLVILDVDGVIRNSYALVWEGSRRAIASVGLKYKPGMRDTAHMRMTGKYVMRPNGMKALLAIAKSGADLSDIMKHADAEARFDKLIAAQLGPEDQSTLDTMLETYKKFYGGSEGKKYVKIYPNAAKAIGLLRAAGLKLGMVSAAHKESLERDIIGKYEFDATISDEDVVNKKPHPEGLLKVMKTVGIGPKQTVFVGDAWADIRAAHSAGCYSIGVTTGLSLPSHLEREHPDLLVRDLYAAAKVILNDKA